MMNLHTGYFFRMWLLHLCFGALVWSGADNADFAQTTKDDDPNIESDLRKAIDDYFGGQFSAQDVSPDTINDFHDKIRRKFSILSLRPKDGCPVEDNSVRARNLFYCPTPNPFNVLEWKCVMTDELCNGIPDCPGSEDEDPTLCLFWLAGQEQLRQLRKILIKQFVSENLITKAPALGHRESENMVMAKFSLPYRINRLQ